MRVQTGNPLLTRIAFVAGMALALTYLIVADPTNWEDAEALPKRELTWVRPATPTVMPTPSPPIPVWYYDQGRYVCVYLCPPAEDDPEWSCSQHGDRRCIDAQKVTIA